MRKIVMASIAAAVLTAGCATTREDVREERQDLREAQANGSREEVRDARDDLREKRQELQEDKKCGPAYGTPC